MKYLVKIPIAIIVGFLTKVQFVKVNEFEKNKTIVFELRKKFLDHSEESKKNF